MDQDRRSLRPILLNTKERFHFEIRWHKSRRTAPPTIRTTSISSCERPSFLTVDIYYRLFWVFISPIFIIILAKGFDFTYSKIKLKAIFPLVTALILFAPVAQSITYIIHPDEFYVHKKSFQREALMYINDKYKKGDITYIYWNNLPGYRLYQQMYQFRINAKEGRDFRSISKDFRAYFEHLKPDLVNLSKNKRIWLVFNNLYLN